MPTLEFAITWDYRCPFAWKANDHVLTALGHGADWQVTFVPFSLGQVHVADGEPPIWDRPGDDSGLLALQAGVAVRDHFPEHFRAAHRALFELRHRHSGQLRDRDAVEKALTGVGVDAAAVLAEIDGGGPLRTIRTEHEAYAASHQVWGVPTFIVGDRAAFVRLMDGAGTDPGGSVAAIERIVDLVGGWPELNELKHTSIPN